MTAADRAARAQARRVHRGLLAIVIALVVVTGIGVFSLWPDRDAIPDVGDFESQELVEGVIRAIEVTEADYDDPIVGRTDTLLINVDVSTGPEAGDDVEISTIAKGLPPLDVGDRVLMARSIFEDGDGNEVIDYFLADFPRRSALWRLGLLFAVTVIAVGGWHGVRSLISLGLSMAIVTQFILPAILSGANPSMVALFGAMAVMLVTLYLTHGVNVVTTAAVLGTTAALLLTIALGVYFIDSTSLTGLTSEEVQLANFLIPDLDLRGLVLAGLIIATLGVLDDVTIAQASTVFQLHRADDHLGTRELFTRAMVVGRDHISSTVNTLVLAYAGASLATLLVFTTGGLPVGEIIASEVIAEEIVKTIVGSLGLIAAVPAATLLAAFAVSAGILPDGDLHDHAHGNTPPPPPRPARPERPKDERLPGELPTKVAPWPAPIDSEDF